MASCFCLHFILLNKRMITMLFHQMNDLYGFEKKRQTFIKSSNQWNGYQNIHLLNDFYINSYQHFRHMNVSNCSLITVKCIGIILPFYFSEFNDFSELTRHQYVLIIISINLHKGWYFISLCILKRM